VIQIHVADGRAPELAVASARLGARELRFNLCRSSQSRSPPVARIVPLGAMP
jgi:hypothetical protein